MLILTKKHNANNQHTLNGIFNNNAPSQTFSSNCAIAASGGAALDLLFVQLVKSEDYEINFVF